MPKRTSEYREVKIELGDLPNSYFKLEVLVTTIHNPIRIEEGHGVHFFNEDEVSVSVLKAFIAICGFSNEIQLTQHQVKLLEEYLVV